MQAKEKKELPAPRTRLELLLASKRMPGRKKVRLLRRFFRMTAGQFSDAFRIPEQTILDWETGRTRLRREQLSYLRVIAGMPEEVCRIHRSRTVRPPGQQAGS
jgi:DNA-binding transcriptional regulator YiaG